MDVVADPEAKARPYAPPDSRDARVRSKAARLGLLDREYSKPCHSEALCQERVTYEGA